MRKQEAARDENRISIIPEYGRQRLLMYADSFRELAEFFEEEESGEEEKPQETAIVDRQDRKSVV